MTLTAAQPQAGAAITWSLIMKSFSMIAVPLIAIAGITAVTAHAKTEPALAPADAAPATHTSTQHKLPLDHGPRAQSTPWVNQQTVQHEAKAADAARHATQTHGRSD
jgi:hypothetical protein